MPTNFYWYFITALIPMLVGSLYYGPIVGKQWLAVNGYTTDDLDDGKLPMILLACYALSVLLSFGLTNVVVHQSGVAQTLMSGDGTFTAAATEQFNTLMAEYGNRYRSFGHGALHGAMFALFIAWPIIAINAMFERRGAKYVAIHVGYWVITLALMGGVLCHFLEWGSL